MQCFFRYFKEFGRVIKSTVVFDKSTGTSKGFGFVTFNDAKAWDNVSNQQIHKIEGWRVNVEKSTNVGKNF